MVARRGCSSSPSPAIDAPDVPGDVPADIAADAPPACADTSWRLTFLGAGEAPVIAVDSRGDVHALFVTDSFGGDVVYGHLTAAGMWTTLPVFTGGSTRNTAIEWSNETGYITRTRSRSYMPAPPSRCDAKNSPTCCC